MDKKPGEDIPQKETERGEKKKQQGKTEVETVMEQLQKSIFQAPERYGAEGTEGERDFFIQNLPKYDIARFNIAPTKEKEFICVTTGVHKTTSLFQLTKIILKPTTWKIIKIGDENAIATLSIEDIGKKIAELMNVDAIKTEKEKKLIAIWQEMQPIIETELYEIFLEKIDTFVKILLQIIISDTESPSIIIAMVGHLIYEAQTIIKNNTREEYKAKLTKIVKKVSKIKERLKAAYEKCEVTEEKKRVQQEKVQQEKEIDELRKAHSINRIETDATFLKQLYAIGTGLNLDKAEDEIEQSSETEENITYPSKLGLYMLPLQIQDKRPRFGCLSLGKEIPVFFGDDLNSIQQRARMINWVDTHRMAELVNYALEKPSEKIAQDKKTAYEGISCLFDEKDQSIVKEMLEHEAQESVLDGIALQLVNDYGTTHDTDKTREQRIKTAQEAFKSSIEVFTAIGKDSQSVKNLARRYRKTEAELQLRIAFVALRMIAVGHKLVVDVKQCWNILDQTIKIANNKEILMKIIKCFAECFEEGKSIKLNKTIARK